MAELGSVRTVWRQTVNQGLKATLETRFVLLNGLLPGLGKVIAQEVNEGVQRLSKHAFRRAKGPAHFVSFHKPMSQLIDQTALAHPGLAKNVGHAGETAPIGSKNGINKLVEDYHLLFTTHQRAFKEPGSRRLTKASPTIDGLCLGFTFEGMRAQVVEFMQGFQALKGRCTRPNFAPVRFHHQPG